MALGAPNQQDNVPQIAPGCGLLGRVGDQWFISKTLSTCPTKDASL